MLSDKAKKALFRGICARLGKQNCMKRGDTYKAMIPVSTLRQAGVKSDASLGKSDYRALNDYTDAELGKIAKHLGAKVRNKEALALMASDNSVGGKMAIERTTLRSIGEKKEEMTRAERKKKNKAAWKKMSPAEKKKFNGDVAMPSAPADAKKKHGTASVNPEAKKELESLERTGLNYSESFKGDSPTGALGPKLRSERGTRGIEKKAKKATIKDGHKQYKATQEDEELDETFGGIEKNMKKERGKNGIERKAKRATIKTAYKRFMATQKESAEKKTSTLTRTSMKHLT